VSAGELVDKITILEIKAERIAEPAKRANIMRELAALAAIRTRELAATPALDRLAAELRSVNRQLWDVEDGLRACERHGRFGPDFISLARSVYRCNDRRAFLKRRINQLTGSAIVEEKFYDDQASWTETATALMVDADGSTHRK
jgi:hypothetical protein